MNLLQNPLLIISSVFFIAVLVYFSFEIIHSKHKTREEKLFSKIGWGVLAIALAVIILFTTMLNVLADVSNILPSDLKGAYLTIDEVHRVCRDGELESKSIKMLDKYKGDCKYANYLYYGSLVLVIIGVVWIIFIVFFELINRWEKPKGL